MRESDVELNSQRFHLRHWGHPDAPILLMLHGFPEYSGAWADVAHFLADRYHCIAPDQRGYGQSWAPPEVSNYTTSRLVSDMAALIDQLGAPVTVIGHDWGAAVAYGLAINHPELVDRLIVINGVHPGPFQREIAAGGAQTQASQYIHTLRRDGSEERLSANNFDALLRLFSANMDLSWLQGEALKAYRTEWSRPGRLRGMINWYRASPLRVALPGQPLTDLPELPAERLMVRVPHLLIWGQRDTALLPESHRGLEAFAPDLTRAEVADADHWICHQKPQQVAQLIREWLPA